MLKIDYSKCSCGAKKNYTTHGCRQCWHCSDENCGNCSCDNSAGMVNIPPIGFDPDDPKPKVTITHDPYDKHPPKNSCNYVHVDWTTRRNLDGSAIDENTKDLYSTYETTATFDWCTTKKCRIYRTNKNNPLPTQANSNDAGWDVYASETVTFRLGETKLVPLGIIAEAPVGYHFKLCIRSSIPYKRGFCIANSIGIIDSSYCGPKDEIKIILRAPYPGTKYDHREHTINEGERIGQLILEKNNNIEWEEQDSADFAETSRGGFGSSDNK